MKVMLDIDEEFFEMATRMASVEGISPSRFMQVVLEGALLNLQDILLPNE